MKKRLKPIPKFANETAERAFWEASENDSTEYIDWSKARLAVLPKLKPSTESISLRMPENLLDTIRSHAQRLDVPYQSLIKLWIAEKVALLAREERAPRRRTN
jgi:predicted DNA binding CopG/RHH family protein